MIDNWEDKLWEIAERYKAEVNKLTERVEVEVIL